MKFLIKKSPDGFIKSVNDEISSILNRNFDSLFPEYIFTEDFDKLTNIQKDLLNILKTDIDSLDKDGIVKIQKDISAFKFNLLNIQDDVILLISSAEYWLLSLSTIEIAIS